MTIKEAVRCAWCGQLTTTPVVRWPTPHISIPFCNYSHAERYYFHHKTKTPP
jgi:hypothetical protein